MHTNLVQMPEEYQVPEQVQEGLAWINEQEVTRMERTYLLMMYSRNMHQTFSIEQITFAMEEDEE